ncbi:MAG: hypothetical protein ACJ78K_08155, partial [Gemmatimonadaceae bacterium]
MRSAILMGGAVAAVFACASPPPPPPPPRPVVVAPPTDTVRLPLTELASYYGIAGGLYPATSNFIPPGHDSAARASRNRVRALDVNGDESPFGKYVLISIGMGNASEEW